MIPHDLSPFGMFMNADVVVKGVMIGLAFGSLVTWTLLLAKAVELLGARRRALAAGYERDHSPAPASGAWPSAASAGPPARMAACVGSPSSWP